MLNKIKKVFTSLTLAAVSSASLAQASATFQNWHEYEQAGYLSMNSLTTPLLHYVRTGQRFDPFSLARGAESLLPSEMKRAYNSLLTSEYMAWPDEFKKREVQSQLEAFMIESSAPIKDAGGYLFLATGRLLDYDWSRKGFPLQIALPDEVKRSKEHLACPGFHSSYRKSCISAPNFESDLSFRFLRMEDQVLAKVLRDRSNTGDLQFLVVAHVNGKYRAFNSPSMTVGNGAFILGIQPTKAVELLFLDRRNGTILAKISAGKFAGSQIGTASPGGETSLEVVSVTARLDAVDGVVTSSAPVQGPIAAQRVSSKSNADGSESAARSVGQIVVGLPQDPETQLLDKLLAMLAYAVYSDPGKVRTTQRELDDLVHKYKSIEGDQGRESTLQQIELNQLASKIQSKQQHLEQLQRLEQLKRDGPSQYGAKPLRSAKHETIYHEIYRLNDGRHIVVFRGTDNKDDLQTDLQLALNPDTVAEMSRRLAGGKFSDMVTGMQVEVMGVDGLMTSARPQAFLSAEKIVAELIRAGVSASKIILTGHSLGGGLAQYVGFKNGVQTVVTFNPAPLSPQLMADAKISRFTSRTVARHYISTATSESGNQTADPVSSKLAGIFGIPQLRSLQVVGVKHAVEVCNGLGSPEFKAFLDKSDRKILGGAVKIAALGADDAKKKATLIGQAAGVVLSNTEKLQAAKTGGELAGKSATGLRAAQNCMNHPILCPLGAAGSLVAMGVARERLPAVWVTFQAHRMQPLYESIAADGSPACLAAGVRSEILSQEE